MLIVSQTTKHLIIFNKFEPLLLSLLVLPMASRMICSVTRGVIKVEQHCLKLCNYFFTDFFSRHSQKIIYSELIKST